METGPRPSSGTTLGPAADLVWLCGPEPRPVFIRRSLAARLGMTAENPSPAEGQVFTPDSLARLEAAASGAHPEPVVELCAERADGSSVRLAVQVRPLRRGDGALVGLVGTALGACASRASEQDPFDDVWNGSEILLEDSSEGIIVCDEGHIVFVNRAIERLTGLSRTTLTTQTILDLIHPDDERGGLEAHLHPSDSVQPRYQTIRIVRADGRMRWVELHAVATSWRDRPALLYFARDISDYKRTELELAEALANQERRVRERTEQLEEANARLRREAVERRRTERALLRADRLTAIGTLAGGVAHEFNNIHQIISGWTRLLLDQPTLSAQGRDIVHRILRASQRGGEVAGNLLRFSHGDKQRHQRASLTAIAQDVLALVRREYESEGVSFRILLPEVPPIPLDLNQMSQVIMTLLINARHALLGQEHKEISVETGCEAERVFLAVADTGCGIADEELARVFAPFFTTKGEFAAAGSPQARVKGTGLGLSVAQTIVGDHGGELMVSSQPGRGSRFVVYLPLKHEPLEQQELEPAEPQESEPVGLLRLEGRRILVVEDEPDVSELALRVLRRTGATVQSSSDGGEALARLQAQSFDLLLVDMQMPVVTGEDFLLHLATWPLPVRPRVILMSGRQMSAKETCGADQLLQKPFTPDRLLRAVRAALSDL